MIPEPIDVDWKDILDTAGFAFEGLPISKEAEF